MRTSQVSHLCRSKGNRTGFAILALIACQGIKMFFFFQNRSPEKYNMTLHNRSGKEGGKKHEFLQIIPNTIAAIRQTTGLNNISHFSSLFKSHFGHGPT
jgi:AraC-like DNA-binding protein